MKVIDLEIEDLKLIELDIFQDSRGFFVERFNTRKFQELGLNAEFVQDNHSYSKPGVLRGLHFQFNPSQGKLVGVTRGTIWDVMVDLRQNSKTYLKYCGVELSGNSGKLLWIPKGFAHGFCVLGDQPADVFYKVDDFYTPNCEAGILWNDKDLNIKWPVGNPIVSEKDQKLLSLETFTREASTNSQFRF